MRCLGRSALLVIISLCGAQNSNASVDLSDLTQKVLALEDEYYKSDPVARPYDKGYFDSIQANMARKVSCAGILPDALVAQFILIGDEHGTLDPIILVENILHQAVLSGQKATLVIEFIFRRHQAYLDAFMAAHEDKRALAKLRKQIDFDGFGWGWKWNDITRVLLAAKHLHLRVIAGELGLDGPKAPQHTLEERDKFTISEIEKDLSRHLGEKYVVLYGTMHILGPDHLSGLLAADGHLSQLKTIRLLGRRTQDVVEAIGITHPGCMSLGDGVIYNKEQDLVESLQAYYEDLKQSVGHGWAMGF